MLRSSCLALVCSSIVEVGSLRVSYNSATLVLYSSIDLSSFLIVFPVAAAASAIALGASINFCTKSTPKEIAKDAPIVVSVPTATCLSCDHALELTFILFVRSLNDLDSFANIFTSSGILRPSAILS